LILLVRSVPGRRAGGAVCELPLELEPEADEVPDAGPPEVEPPPRGVPSGPPEEDPPPPEPPPVDVDGTGTEGTFTSGVEAGPTFTDGTFTGGVDDGVGTLGPPGTSTFAGMAVSVGTDASRQTSAVSANTVASVALRKTPAVVIRVYPRAEL
jgi:hypothetical protein